MTPYPKRLIEVDLPIARISAHARREKSIRHGHISTLHIWWARRPLAACRAVILGSLWPDPVDLAAWGEEADDKGEVRAPRGVALKPGDGVVIRPRRFLDEARARMGRWATVGYAKASTGKIAKESADRLVKLQRSARLLDDPAFLRSLLLDFIADFANWDNSTDADFLDLARALTQAAHEALGGEPGSRPMVIDPFAGGGSIPLEALRVGADAFASDLNPIPVLLNKVVLEYIPRHGQRLADEVRKWGQWIKEEAQKELAQFYPKDKDGSTPIAYLWARTILSEAPGQGDIPVEVPLMRSLWLAKRSGTDRAMRWVRDASGRVKTQTVDVGYFEDGRTVTRKVKRPLLELFAPTRDSEVEGGTVARGSATCPVTGFTTPVTSVRRQLKLRRGGASDARLLAVRQDNAATGARMWRLPSELDIAAAEGARVRMNEWRADPDTRSLFPDEPTPLGGGRGAGRAFSQRHYGMDTFPDLFTPRQLLALSTLCRSLGRVQEQVQASALDEPALATAVRAFLALALDRLADFCSSLCVLNIIGGRGVVHTFGRQALPIVWDFAETNPLNDVGANWMGGVGTCADTIVAEAGMPFGGQVEQASATCHPLPSDVASAFVTDPPYYDAVPYSDLADYFYVWLKRSLPVELRANFQKQLTPKTDECIVDDAKGKDRLFFERGMKTAMSEGRRVVRPDGIGVVVFAHKSTAGWEAQLQAMVDAGWVITGSWPIDTERPGRLRAMNSAALASSVHLVCRPRETIDGSVSEGDVGEWRHVLAELPRKIEEWMPRLADEGVVGADAIFACLGPALEVFSRYTRVERASGEAVTLGEYLEHVWAAVSNEALSMIFKGADAAGLEPDARLTAMWLWTVGGGKSNGAVEAGDAEDESAAADDEEESSGKKPKLKGFALEFDAARKIAQGLGVHLEKSVSIVEVKGETARLLPVAERVKTLFGKDSEAGGGGATVQPQGKRRKAEATLFQSAEEVKAEIITAEAETAGKLAAARPGATVLDRVHQAMLLFSAGRGDALKRFLVDDGIGKDGRFWKLAQSLSALYPAGTDEKRWVDGVLARKKGLGF